MVANSYDADPGFVGEHLRRAGFAFTECHREHPDEWPDLEGVGLVLSLGSDWSVYWDRVRQEVEAEAALLRTAHDSGIPVLGICFGGQMLAHCLGGSVVRAPEPEIGWYAVDSDQPELHGSGPWFQWHADRFTAPPGSVRLAVSERAEQCFRIGRTVGLQFHPEVNESIVSRWATGGAEELAHFGIEPAALVEETRKQVGRSRLDAARLVQWFCDGIAGT
jgi:GMP synthase-like glutamine amidotransferase